MTKVMRRTAMPDAHAAALPEVAYEDIEGMD
jgi:hypothetical protein